MKNPLQQYMIMAIVFFVVIPALKAIWALLTKEDPPEDTSSVPDSVRQVAITGLQTSESAALNESASTVSDSAHQVLVPDLQAPEIAASTESSSTVPDAAPQVPVPDLKAPENAGLNWWKENMRNPGAFLAVEAQGGSVVHFYSKKEIPDSLYSSILAGNHGASSNSVLYTKGEGEAWDEKAQPLQQLISQHFKLRRLYHPRWAYALAGLKWGALVGGAGKLLDTAIGLLSVEPGAALCFLAAVGICFVPRVGIIGMIALSFFMSQFYKANFFMMGMAAALAGALLGCLPGMAIGGIIASARKKSLPLAPDAKVEDDAGLMKTVLLPLTGGVLLIGFYVFVFHPWLVRYLVDNSN
jgi:hypothetical protein